VTTILHLTEERIFQGIPFWKIPWLPSTVKFKEAKEVLMKEIEGMITKRRARAKKSHEEDGSGEGDGSGESDGEDLGNAQDLLGRLLAAEDPDTHETLSDSQLADELITFLIAGHGALISRKITNLIDKL
jgi:cytochrome P450